MHEARTFLQDLTLVFCVAAVVVVIFRRLRQPVVLGYLLAGVIIGPYVPIPLFVDAEHVHALSELGVILVMFSIGLELSVVRFMRVLPTAGLTGLIQIGGMIWLGYVVGRLFGWTWRESLFAGAIVSISSTMIVAQTFASEKVGRQLSELTFGILIVEDLAAVLLITLLTTIASGSGMSAGEMGEVTGKLALFLLCLLVIGFLVVPRAIRAVSRLESPEALLVVSVGLCFGASLLAQALGYSVALGAFVAGSLIAESGKRRQIEHRIAPLRDLFAAVFFVSVGMMVDPLVVLEHWPVVLVLTGVVFAGKICFITLGSFLSGVGLRTSVRAGMSLAQIGEFSFIIAGVGVARGAIGDFLYPVAVAVAVITTFATPWLVRVSESVAAQVERRLPGPVQTFAALYGTWLEALRARASAEHGRRPIRRLVLRLVLDSAVLTALAVATAVAWPRLLALAERYLGLPRALSAVLVILLAATLAAPFALGVLRCARRLGVALATAALPLPPGAPGRVDLAATPRRAFILSLQLAIILLVGVPILAVTQLFLPLLYGVPILLAAVLALGVGLWRSTTNLDGHVRAGAELVLEVLGRQSVPEDGIESELESLLPGLGSITPVRLDERSPAVSHTLAGLDLRGRTGASVLAILRGEQGVVTPTGSEALLAGDVLVLLGTREAIDAATGLLLGTAAEPGPARGSDPADPW